MRENLFYHYFYLFIMLDQFKPLSSKPRIVEYIMSDTNLDCVKQYITKAEAIELFKKPCNRREMSTR